MTDSTLSGSGAPYGRLIGVLAENWWAIAIRGGLGILFGLVALFLPAATMLTLALLFGAYAFADGALGARGRAMGNAGPPRPGKLRHHRRRFLLARHHDPHLRVPGRGVGRAERHPDAGVRLPPERRRRPLVAGARRRGLADLRHPVLAVAPMAGAVVLTWWLGAYALVFGIALLVAAFTLRARRPSPR